MSPVKMVVGETTEQAAEAAKAEKKRLKKLAKAKAALLGTTTVTNNDPTEDWTMTKKEKKAKAKAAAADDSIVSMDDQNNKKKKNKKRKHQDGEDIENSGAVNGAVPMRRQRTRSETKLDWADEVEQAIPSLLDSAKKKNKGDKKKEGDGEPAAKKKKKEKKAVVDPSVKVEEEVKEKGAFRKIFYKPTEATLNMPKKEMLEFQEKHKMNLTGRLAEIYKPIQVLHGFRAISY